MIKRTNYKQETAETTWNVQLPEGATKGRPLAAYDAAGNSMEIDNWAFGSDDRILHVNFGIDPVAGELEYEYSINESQPIHEEDKPLVSITNNYGGVNLDHGSFH